MIKLVYKPVSLLVSVLGGMLAGGIFKKIWQLAAHEDEAPQATDAARSWPEILLAAALQGAIFAVVKAALDRSAAAGTRKLTGTWPGEDRQSHDDDRAQAQEAS
jgi:predicted metal-dependent enzyme (double-stranded beta helix superfamily)